MATPSDARVGPLGKLWVFLAAGLGAGFFPVAPATFASLLVTIAYGLIAPSPGGVTMLTVLAIAAAVFAVGVPLATRTERVLGHDARPIVIDEIVGQLITLAGLPRVSSFSAWPTW
jgi:phosphatidylglycerophosphatase A